MKKIHSKFIERLNGGEGFWVALPAHAIRQLPIGLLMNTMTIGGIAVITGKDLVLHNKKFHGNGKDKK